MKHIFILNPVAGHGKAEEHYLPQIQKAVKEAGVDFEIHRTINVGDATRFVRSRCQEQSTETLRFYAVGGDGTLNEVVNGAMGASHAEVAFIPSGSGNDFARSFPNSELFKNVLRQLKGTSTLIDVLQYNEKYAINMLNIGLDCQVVSVMNRLKYKTFLKGPLAYMAGVGIVFVGNQGYEMEIVLEDGTTSRGSYTLVAIGNGAYCGGGFCGVPRAKWDDGLMDVSLIEKVNRRTFLSLIGSYRKGTHLETSLGQRVVTYVQCRSLRMKDPTGNQLDVCIDGEIEQVKELSVNLLPKALRFSIPEGCE